MKYNLLSLAVAITSLLFVGCKKEIFINQPGNLVPQTVEQDSSIPSININGAQLHAETFGNKDSAMVIFLHGGPGSDYRNGLNAKQLADNGYYVVFYDQRGAGLSKRHDENSYSVQLYLDDLSAVIKHYRSSPLQKIFLFGHSWGAMLAAAYINTYPDSIAGVVFAEPGGFTNEMMNDYIKRSGKTNLFLEAINDAAYLDQFLTGGKDKHEIMDYKLGMSASFTYRKGNEEGIEGPSPSWRNGAAVLNGLLNISNKQGFDFTKNLNQFTPKVLFLYSEFNRAYGLSFAQKMAAYFSKNETAKIQGTGHEMIYFKWNNVYPIVLNYLNSLK